MLLPKRNRDLLGICLIKVIWKTVLGVVNCWIRAAVTLHNTFHRLWDRQGTGNTIVKTNMIQNLIVMREEILYNVLIDLWKAY